MYRFSISSSGNGSYVSAPPPGEFGPLTASEEKRKDITAGGDRNPDTGQSSGQEGSAIQIHIQPVLREKIEETRAADQVDGPPADRPVREGVVVENANAAVFRVEIIRKNYCRLQLAHHRERQNTP